MYVYIYINNIYAHMVGCMQYEGHRAKKDPEHAQRHKIEAGVDGGGAGRRRLRVPRTPRAEGGPLRGQGPQGAARLPLQLITERSIESCSIELDGMDRMHAGGGTTGVQLL